VSTQKKELIGNFKNSGQAWCRQAEAVLVHDFPQDAVGQAVPYGIYTLNDNHGYVCVGDGFDTPRFAVEAISEWWSSEGYRRFPLAKPLLILADAGGSNSCRSRVWKAQLQEQLCDACRLAVTVCHYPTGCSKWNPIEHRLFSHISMNWAGKPLRSFELMVDYIAGTTTRSGLTVTGVLKRGGNETGERVTDEEMKRLRIKPHPVCPQWNYTLQPHPQGSPLTANTAN
jgi:Rhodopirellula transposase.